MVNAESGSCRIIQSSPYCLSTTRPPAPHLIRPSPSLVVRLSPVDLITSPIESICNSPCSLFLLLDKGVCLRSLLRLRRILRQELRDEPFFHEEFFELAGLVHYMGRRASRVSVGSERTPERRDEREGKGRERLGWAGMGWEGGRLRKWKGEERKEREGRAGEERRGKTYY